MMIVVAKFRVIVGALALPRNGSRQCSPRVPSSLRWSTPRRAP